MPCTTLVRGPRKPVRSSSSIGEQPCSARHSSSSRRCSCAWTWRTRPCASAYAAIASSHGAGTARTLCAATPTRDAVALGRPRAQGVHAREERLDVGVAEAPLARARPAAPVPAVAVVGGGEQHDLRARRRAPPPRPRSPSRSAPRRACRRAGGGRSGTRRPRRSPPPPSRRTRGPRRRASSRGRARPRAGTSPCASVQKSSCACAPGAPPTPRRSRWNACECAFTIAGHARGPHAASLSSARSIAVAAAAASSSVDVLLRRVAHAGRVAHEHHPGGQPLGDHARVVAGEADELGRVRRAARSAARTAGSNATPALRDAVAQLDPHAGALGERRRRRPRAASRQRVDRGRLRRARVEPQPHVRGHRGERVRLDEDARGGDDEVGVASARSSAATISRAAADIASRRSARRVVPAWSARPWRSTCSRSRDASAGHDAGRRPRRGEVARLVDVQLEEPAQPRRATRARARARPGRRRRARIASRSDTPSSSRRASTSSTSSRPDQRAAAERRRVEARALLVGERDHGDRALASGRDRERRRRRRARRRSAPPSRTLSRCEPTAHHGPSPVGQRPQVAGGVALDLAPEPGGLRGEPARGGRRPRPSRPAGSRRPPSSADPSRPAQALRQVVGRRSSAAPATPASGRTHTGSPPTNAAATGLWPSR